MTTSYNLMGSPTVVAPQTTVSASGSGSWFSDFSMPQISPMVGPLLSTFGAINGAIGSYYQAQAMQNNIRFQADMAKINSKISETNAQAVLLSGQRAQQNVRMRTSKIKAAQTVGMAANGVDLGSRSAVNVRTTTDVMGEIDAQTVEANAIRAAFGYRTQSVNDMNTARLSDAVADGISPLGSATGSLIGNAGKVAEGWYRYSKGYPSA
jgi:hypothetical protein